MSGIKAVYLFGSVARNDFDEDSDIDVFVDADKKDVENLEKLCSHTLGKFLKNEGEKYRLRGLDNKISIKVGELSKWDLKSSVDAEGITLFSRAGKASYNRMTIFSFSPIKSPKDRIRIVRKLFGRAEQDYQAKGLVHELGGIVINPRTFMIPSLYAKKILQIFSKEKVTYRLEEVWQ